MLQEIFDIVAKRRPRLQFPILLHGYPFPVGNRRNGTSQRDIKALEDIDAESGYGLSEVADLSQSIVLLVLGGMGKLREISEKRVNVLAEYE